MDNHLLTESELSHSNVLFIFFPISDHSNLIRTFPKIKIVIFFLNVYVTRSRTFAKWFYFEEGTSATSAMYFPPKVSLAWRFY